MKFAIIGAGGIGCAIAPLLSRLGDIVIIDADSYEPKNVERQFPALTSDKNKAETLADMLRPHTLNKVEHIPTYVQNINITSHPEWSGVDAIVGAVDNNESRLILNDLANDLDIIAILGGNSHEHGEAHLVIPEVYSPFSHFEFPIVPHTAPWGCNKDSVVDEFPQTPAANYLAAACVVLLLQSWKKAKNPLNCLAYARFDNFSSISKTVKSILQEKDEKLN